MSGECNECVGHALECICNSAYVLQNTCGYNCPCKLKECNTHLNLLMRHMIEQGTDPPSQYPETRYVNVRGREEHEAVLKDAALCEQLGLDQYYEIMVYLKRWGSWLRQ